MSAFCTKDGRHAREASASLSGTGRHWLTWAGLAIMFTVSWLPLPADPLIGQGAGLLLYALHLAPAHAPQSALPAGCRSAGAHRARAHFRAATTLLDNGIVLQALRWRLRWLVCLQASAITTMLRWRSSRTSSWVPHFLGSSRRQSPLP